MSENNLEEEFGPLLEGLEEYDASKHMSIEDEEEELNKIKKLLEEAEVYSGAAAPAAESGSDSVASDQNADARSIWIGNVDYGATAEELEAHFKECGPIVRVSILCDKFSGQPKGFAYLEFENQKSLVAAMNLSRSLFRGRALQVTVKRTNRPGISSTNRPPRARSFGSFRGRSMTRPSTFRARRGYSSFKAVRPSSSRYYRPY